MQLLFIPIFLFSMQNHETTLKLTHHREETLKEETRIVNQYWDLEADCWKFDWPQRERFMCLRTPSVKAAIIAGCASVSAAAIAGLAFMIVELAR